VKTLFLHGYLKEKYGEFFNLDVATTAEALRAVAVQVPGFEADVRAGNWHVLRGPLDAEDSMDADGILVTLGNQNEVHLLPAVAGANVNALMVVAGVVLMALGYFTFGLSLGPGMALFAAGAGMALGGIIGMTMKLPMGGDPASQEATDNRPSFLFNGPTNTSSQGLAVPRGYGRVRVGSIVISASVQSEELAA
jgi:predicted phage tail protein